MRLDRFIAEQMNISRSDAKEYIRRGRISVNGSICRRGELSVEPEKDAVSADGRSIIYREFIYIMLNKPAGTVCAVRDELSPTVLGLIPPELRRKGLFPAGRLDKDTEGFVFITDDGALGHRIISPRSHVDKVYYAELENEADEGYPEAFASGMEIDGGERCLPASIELLEDRRKVMITLHEGKYHQVKRMIAALGNKVIYLKRTAVGGIPLDPALKPGECREILHKEIENLYSK